MEEEVAEPEEEVAEPEEAPEEAPVEVEEVVVEPEVGLILLGYDRVQLIATATAKFLISRRTSNYPCAFVGLPNYRHLSGVCSYRGRDSPS